MTLDEFTEHLLTDAKSDVGEAGSRKHLKDKSRITLEEKALNGNFPQNTRKPVSVTFDKDFHEAEELCNLRKIYVPVVTCGDLSGYDSDTTYPTPEGYVTLPPVQSPISPPYAEAVARKKQDAVKGQKRDLVCDGIIVS
jgi:hypothetical protein